MKTIPFFKEESDGAELILWLNGGVDSVTIDLSATQLRTIIAALGLTPLNEDQYGIYPDNFLLEKVIPKLPKFVAVPQNEND